LFPPPYSSDFKAIGKDRANMKRELRDSAHPERLPETIIDN
jgi:transposase